MDMIKDNKATKHKEVKNKYKTARRQLQTIHLLCNLYLKYSLTTEIKIEKWAISKEKPEAHEKTLKTSFIREMQIRAASTRRLDWKGHIVANSGEDIGTEHSQYHGWNADSALQSLPLLTRPVQLPNNPTIPLLRLDKGMMTKEHSGSTWENDNILGWQVHLYMNTLNSTES